MALVFATSLCLDICWIALFTLVIEACSHFNIDVGVLYNILQISLKEAAQPLLDSGVKTLSIGIGASVDKRELRAMVEDDQDVITAENFDQLIKNIKNITQQTCEQISKMLNFCHAVYFFIFGILAFNILLQSKCLF